VRSRLSPLQGRIIEVLAGLGWTLTGGAALAGYHLGHRETRDLDLFWHGRSELGHLVSDVERRLTGERMSVSRIESSPGFCRLRVGDGAEVLPIHLIADPIPCVEPPVQISEGVWVDTPREILANKLTALMSRWAVRDLVDVRALISGGYDLERGLRDASAKDAGLSGPVLAWVLQTTPDTGLDEDLRAFKRELIERLAP